MQFSLVWMQEWYVHSKQLFLCEENSSVLQKNVQMVPFNITADLGSWVSCTSQPAADSGTPHLHSGIYPGDRTQLSFLHKSEWFGTSKIAQQKRRLSWKANI